MHALYLFLRYQFVENHFIYCQCLGCCFVTTGFLKFTFIWNLIDAINSHQIITVRIVAEVTDEFLLIVHDVIGMIYFLPISWPKFVSTQWISCMTLCLADIFYMAL
jgi:hypothetical protein